MPRPMEAMLPLRRQLSMLHRPISQPLKFPPLSRHPHRSQLRKRPQNLRQQNRLQSQHRNLNLLQSQRLKRPQRMIRHRLLTLRLSPNQSRLPQMQPRQQKSQRSSPKKHRRKRRSLSQNQSLRNLRRQIQCPTHKQLQSLRLLRMRQPLTNRSRKHKTLPLPMPSQLRSQNTKRSLPLSQRLQSQPW